MGTNKKLLQVIFLSSSLNKALKFHLMCSLACSFQNSAFLGKKVTKIVILDFSIIINYVINHLIIFSSIRL